MSIDNTVFARRANGLEWLLLDVDGVLTDGRLIYGPRGESLKRFHVHDGLALRLARLAGLHIGLLSGRRSKPLMRRARDLGINEVILGSRDKMADFEAFLERRSVTPAQVAFIGDDLPDLSVLGSCALSFAPADAAPEVLEIVHVVLRSSGGRGAGREMVEMILKARGQWQDLVASFSLEANRSGT